MEEIVKYGATVLGTSVIVGFGWAIGSGTGRVISNELEEKLIEMKVKRLQAKQEKLRHAEAVAAATSAMQVQGSLQS